MEMAHNTMRDLIENKNDVIESQKQIIKGIQNDTDTDTDSTRSKLEEARDIIVQKDIVLDKCNEEIASLVESLSSVGDRKMEHLTHQLESERQLNQDMAKKLEDQVIITNKTELAFSTQTDLVNAKNDIIAGSSCLQLHEGDLTSYLEANSPSNSRTENNNGVQDSCEFIKAHATNGAVLNGFLLWADIVRKSTAENIWKAQAISKFDKDEISDVKEELWRICGESFLGRMVKRQGSGKSELDDICVALKKLSEDNSMPLFLGTSNMVSKTSIFLY